MLKWLPTRVALVGLIDGLSPTCNNEPHRDR